jgi:hypothetical protein
VNASDTLGSVSLDTEAGNLFYTADHPWFDLLEAGGYSPWTSFRFTVESGQGVLTEHVLQIQVGGASEPLPFWSPNQVEETASSPVVAVAKWQDLSTGAEVGSWTSAHSFDPFLL